ncbi:hypothetical protein DIPPA_26471 [Diplonema papillatum]|nr:hypothetical protein DIPPA_26471 [Diplonema papillatum]
MSLRSARWFVCLVFASGVAVWLYNAASFDSVCSMGRGGLPAAAGEPASAVLPNGSTSVVFNRLRKKEFPFTAKPMDRVDPPPARLPPDFKCIVFFADSIGHGGSYIAHTMGVLRAAGYHGDDVKHVRPGIGLSDWLNLNFLEAADGSAAGCRGIVVQLGVNDALKNLSPAAFLALYRGVVDRLRAVHGYEKAIALLSVTPCHIFANKTDRWTHEVSVGISEIAYSYRCLFVDAHWALLKAWRDATPAYATMNTDASWEPVLDDTRCHPTPEGKRKMAIALSGALLRQTWRYSVSFTCGDEVRWAGFTIAPQWPRNCAWHCAANPRVSMTLHNASLLTFNTSVDLIVYPPWASAFARMPAFAKYHTFITLADGTEVKSRIWAPMGGDAIGIPVPAGAVSLSIRFYKSFVMKGMREVRLPRRTSGPAPQVVPDPVRDLDDVMRFIADG